MQLASALAPSCNLNSSPVAVESDLSAAGCYRWLTSRGMNLLLLPRFLFSLSVPVKDQPEGTRPEHTQSRDVTVGRVDKQDTPSPRGHVDGSPPGAARTDAEIFFLFTRRRETWTWGLGVTEGDKGTSSL